MLNYTVKFVLWESGENSDGKRPIYLKITIARKTSYISTGHFTCEKNWNSKTETLKEGHDLPKTINAELYHRKNEIVRKIVEMQMAGKDISAKLIKDSFTGKDLNNIFNFIDNYCLEVKHKRSDDTVDVYRKHSRKLQKYHGSRELSFEQITPAFLSRYENYLREFGSYDKEAENNYVHAIWKTLKTFFNAAKKKKLIDFYPFDEYENPVYVNKIKDYLTLDELEKWEEFVDTTTNDIYKQSGICFLLGSYSGLRISDCLVFDFNTNIENGRIKLRAIKNDEWVSMVISTPLKRNIERIKRLPITIKEQTINEKLKVIAKEIGIKKHLTTHSARHSFAITMCAEKGIGCETCAKLMGITIKTCVENYYRVTNRKIDNETSAAWKDLK